MQAFFLMEDDVMDRSQMRRGRPCWFRLLDMPAHKREPFLTMSDTERIHLSAPVCRTHPSIFFTPDYARPLIVLIRASLRPN